MDGFDDSQTNKSPARWIKVERRLHQQPERAAAAEQCLQRQGQHEGRDKQRYKAEETEQHGNTQTEPPDGGGHGECGESGEAGCSQCGGDTVEEAFQVKRVVEEDAQRVDTDSVARSGCGKEGRSEQTSDRKDQKDQ